MKAVILQDGNGSEAQALLPFTAADKKASRTDWLGLIRGLRKIAFDGILILNLEDTACYITITSPCVAAVRKAGGRLSVLADRDRDDACPI